MQSIDEQVAAAAQARGVVSLADTLNAKVSAAVEIAEQVRQDGFFDEMALHGHVPKTAGEAEEMLAFAQRAIALQQSSPASDGGSLFKAANAVAGRLLGEGSPEATRYAQQAQQSTRAKVASFIAQPGVVQHTLALLDAEELLSQ